MDTAEFDAGPDQRIVLYAPDDTGMEIDFAALFGAIAADAAERAGRGLRLVSIANLPARHAGTAFGNSGSGFQTNVYVAAVYEGPYGQPGTAASSAEATA